MTRVKKPGMPKPNVNWVKGPSLSAPPAELIAWFEAQARNGEPRMTRVPIVMKREAFGFTMRRVTIGSIDARVSDPALGISIVMRTHACTGETCSFIVEGFWRGKEENGYHYEIREASHHPITPEELAAFTHAEVEGGN